ncbi:hypothetical protein B0I35DRAFT_435338 [Stachybotrys elegans]|uniref:Zn(2)-C6 fungal-type domain-containing protein n=1 Tax=Stachybotrys elegans TaxID=80388 RepID=A0A8K0WPN5_9HYPO|nr:hypothetical protein B0I35DRAFT_435338 [Stachybotrys elegans]
MAEEKLSFSCFQCRSRKLKCNRTKPCARCAKSGETCTYPDRRKKPEILASRPKVKDLELRLKELEQKLSNANSSSSSDSAPVQPPSPPDSDALLQTGRYERLPPQDLMDELVDIYFARIHCELPMLHQARYRSSLRNPPARQPPMCLQYAIWALAAAMTPEYKHLGEVYYRRSRNYVEADEMRANGQEFVSVAHAQCWAILARYEVQDMCFSRTAMSCSRAVRLSQILGLDKLDFRTASPHTALPPARDWCELEERRRTFWVVFNADRSTSATTEWPLLIDWKRIQTRLPASDEAFQAGFEEPTMTLREGLRAQARSSSPFANRLMAVHLFQQCTELNSDNPQSGDFDPTEEAMFWKRFTDLDNSLILALNQMPQRLYCPPNIGHDAVVVNVLLQVATICLHRVGRARARDNALLSSIASRVLSAAHIIFNVLSSVTSLDLLFNNPFLSFASFMAASVLLEDFVTTQNPESDERLTVLIDSMVAIGMHNHYTASLVVQLAMTLHASGTDRSALAKVAPLMEKLNMDAPLLAQENSETGSILFCPFEQVKDPPEVNYVQATGLERQYRHAVEAGWHSSAAPEPEPHVPEIQMPWTTGQGFGVSQ